MPLPVFLSARARAWLDDNSQHSAAVYDWLFRLADGSVDKGTPVPGFQPTVYRSTVVSAGSIVRVTHVGYPDRIRVLLIDHWSSN